MVATCMMASTRMEDTPICSRHGELALVYTVTIAYTPSLSGHLRGAPGSGASSVSNSIHTCPALLAEYPEHP